MKLFLEKFFLDIECTLQYIVRYKQLKAYSTFVIDNTLKMSQMITDKPESSFRKSECSL